MRLRWVRKYDSAVDDQAHGVYGVISQCGNDQPNLERVPCVFYYAWPEETRIQPTFCLQRPNDLLRHTCPCPLHSPQRSMFVPRERYLIGAFRE
jgi:hypothetical protein